MTSCFSRAICAERNHLMNLVSVRTRLTVCKMPVKDSSSILTMFNMLSGQIHNQQTGMPTFFFRRWQNGPDELRSKLYNRPEENYWNQMWDFLGLRFHEKTLSRLHKGQKSIIPRSSMARQGDASENFIHSSTRFFSSFWEFIEASSKRFHKRSTSHRDHTRKNIHSEDKSIRELRGGERNGKRFQKKFTSDSLDRRWIWFSSFYWKSFFIPVSFFYA